MISAHSNFFEDIQTERMVDRSWQPDERNSSNAQIRTQLEEQKQTIIAEYREKIDHHELQAHAEEERQLLQRQLWRQKMEFREAHLFLELSSRAQELQNEVNCVNDSKDFQDAESIHSGNSHVTNRPV